MEGRKWRKYLTKAEALALRSLEAKIEKHEGNLGELRRKRRLIQNRASVRAAGPDKRNEG